MCYVIELSIAALQTACLEHLVARRSLRGASSTPTFLGQGDGLKSDVAMQVLEPKQRVLFLDTSTLPDAAECQAGDQLSNPAEADTIMRIVESFQQLGIQSSSIGIISPYRSQVIAIDVSHLLVAFAGLPLQRQHLRNCWARSAVSCSQLYAHFAELVSRV